MRSRRQNKSEVISSACLATLFFFFSIPSSYSVVNGNSIPKGIEPAKVDKRPKQIQGLEIVEHLGEQVSINELQFTNEKGEKLPLSHYFNKGKPVLLTMVYYGCPSLCNHILNGVVDSMKDLKYTPGKEFELVTVSIDHREGPDSAQLKKTSYLDLYGRPEAGKGWHFLTGDEANIKKLAQQIGFGFRWDNKQKEYAHGAAIFTLSPEGKISRYLYGVLFPKTDLKLALLEASQGKIGTIIDRFLMFCYRYDPATHRYSMTLTKVMQAGSATTVLAFGGYLAVFWRRQRKLTIANQHHERSDEREGG